MTPERKPKPTADENTPQVAANVQARAVLVARIKTLILANVWTQITAAGMCGLTQPRISNLLSGNAARFSLDALVNITAALERSPQEGNMMEYNEAAPARMVDEFMTQLAARPVKATYDLATLGSKTRQGGAIASASTGMVIREHRISCVGDVVRYPDGTESKIVSGAGSALAYKGQPMAIVGSGTDNGDTIILSLQSSVQIREYADDGGIAGLLQPGYTASSGA
jgi:predicted XRE-type DNA-binding protein/uncharacterized Zn-binding protein involved in type VI secretion